MLDRPSFGLLRTRRTSGATRCQGDDDPDGIRLASERHIARQRSKKRNRLELARSLELEFDWQRHAAPTSERSGTFAKCVSPRYLHEGHGTFVPELTGPDQTFEYAMGARPVAIAAVLWRPRRVRNLSTQCRPHMSPRGRWPGSARDPGCASTSVGVPRATSWLLAALRCYRNLRNRR